MGDDFSAQPVVTFSMTTRHARWVSQQWSCLPLPSAATAIRRGFPTEGRNP
jgi:hypothetical protein